MWSLVLRRSRSLAQRDNRNTRGPLNRDRRFPEEWAAEKWYAAPLIAACRSENGVLAAEERSVIAEKQQFAAKVDSAVAAEAACATIAMQLESDKEALRRQQKTNAGGVAEQYNMSDTALAAVAALQHQLERTVQKLKACRAE